MSVSLCFPSWTWTRWGSLDSKTEGQVSISSQHCISESPGELQNTWSPNHTPRNSASLSQGGNWHGCASKASQVILCKAWNEKNCVRCCENTSLQERECSPLTIPSPPPPVHQEYGFLPGAPQCSLGSIPASSQAAGKSECILGDLTQTAASTNCP